MKVVFDPQIFSIQRFGGISRYFARMASEMSNQGERVSILAGFHINEYISECPIHIVNGTHLKKYPNKSIRVFRKINQISANWNATLIQPDLIHETYFSSQAIIKKRVPVFITVYDMIQELYPNLFSPHDITTKQKRIALDRADHIFCISHHTKLDLCQLFNIPEKKVSVVHLAADPIFKFDLNNTFQAGKPFFLYVGLRNEYKNFQNFLKAFANSELLKRNFKIIAFGGGGFSLQERGLMADLELTEDQITQTGGSDLDMARLYVTATAFVYPSLYEGFGIPTLEAMSYGCPVVSSNASCMPEVIGDAGLFFDPRQIDDMQSQLEKVVFDSAIRKELIGKGLKRNSEYSWAKTATQTLAGYRKVIGVA